MPDTSAFRLRSALLALAVTGFAGSATAASLDADYSISLLGIEIGSAKLAGTVDSSSYKLNITAKMTGLVGGVTGGRGAGNATGSLSVTRLNPATFAVTAASSSDTRTIRMALGSSAVQAIDIAPPIDVKPDRVPLSETHKRGIIDPISAFLMPVAVGKATSEAACNRSLPIFDGAARYDITMSYAGTRIVKLDGYQGSVVVCNVRYVPIAGHRSERKATAFMANNREISTWLAPIAGTNLVAPVRVSVKTMVGTAVIEATRFEADPGATATAKR
jgi:Protein of unknown function (DUF3108)